MISSSHTELGQESGRVALGCVRQRAMDSMDEREIYELRQLCTAAGLTQDALGNLMDAGASVPSLVRNEAAAMATAKTAGLNMAERSKLRDALRKHRDEVLSAVEPRIVDIGDDAEAHHIVAAQQQLAAERAKRRATLSEEARGEEVVKNGQVLERYRWTQELDSVTVAVELPPGTSKSDVVCKINPNTITLGMRGAPPAVDGALHKTVKVDECMWQLQDSHRLIVQLHKLGLDRAEWWPTLLKGGPEISTDKCESGEATNLFCGQGERRLRVQKVELPPRDPNKKYSPEDAEKSWKDFFVKFPDWGAWEVNFNTRDGETEAQQDERLVDTLSKAFDRSEGAWEKPTESRTQHLQIDDQAKFVNER